MTDRVPANLPYDGVQAEAYDSWIAVDDRLPEESTMLRLLDIFLADDLRRAETNVCRQDFARLHRNRNADATDQEPDPGQSRHRNGQGEQQNAELSGTPLASEHTQAQG